MRTSWIWAAVGFVAAGVAFLLYQKKVHRQPLCFRTEPDEEKNFGEFPPDIPAYEFDGIDFV